LSRKGEGKKTGKEKGGPPVKGGGYCLYHPKRRKKITKKKLLEARSKKRNGTKLLGEFSTVILFGKEGGR